MGTKRIKMSPILEKVSAAVLLIVAAFSVLSGFIDCFFPNNANAKILNLAFRLFNVAFIALPLAIMAFIVLTGKLRDPRMKKVLTVLTCVYLFGVIVYSAAYTITSIHILATRNGVAWSGPTGQRSMMQLIKTVVSNIVSVVLSAVVTALMLDAIWNKIKWSSKVPLLAAAYVLLVVGFITSGFRVSYYLVFLLLLSIFLREESELHPSEISAAMGGFLYAALSVVSAVVSPVFSVLMTLAIRRSGGTQRYADLALTGAWTLIIIGVIAFIASLVIPLLYLSRRIGSQEPPAERVSLDKE